MQVQELKEMTDRISYLETEGRELTRQLSTLEKRIKAYQVNRISATTVALIAVATAGKGRNSSNSTSSSTIQATAHPR